jgi:hypothetical protein
VFSFDSNFFSVLEVCGRVQDQIFTSEQALGDPNSLRGGAGNLNMPANGFAF